MNLIVISLLVLGVTGLASAILLYLVAQKFKVEEDPRIDEVQEVLPGANCGGCGFAGCRALAEACTKASSLDGLLCPVGGQATMNKVADILGMAAVVAEPKVAVVRCNGTCEARPKTSAYDGVKHCDMIHSLYSGETGCRFGCLGCGDCVRACAFGALSIDEQTGLPVVDEDKCTACGKCTKACPRGLIELRWKGTDGARMTVLCRNQDKGAITHKVCTNGCIGCGKCEKVCGAEAIKIENNLAYIDYTKCVLCRDCEKECSTGAIHAMNLPALAGKSPVASVATAPSADATGENAKFDPAIAAKIKSMPTPKACYPNLLNMIH